MEITVTADWRSYDSPAFPVKKIRVGAIIGEVEHRASGSYEWQVYVDAWTGDVIGSGTADCIDAAVSAAESAITTYFTQGDRP